MAQGDTPTSLVNRAIGLIGDRQGAVTGTAPNFDSSAAGQAAKRLYPGAVATVARSFEWDFARRYVSLVESGGTAPYPWAFEYLYPSNGIEIWQVLPEEFDDPFDPLPVNWAVGNVTIDDTLKKVIWTDISSARVYYNNNPTPDLWDATFTEAVVRLLASEFAMDLAGRPETAQNLLSSAGQFTEAAKSRDG